MDWVEAQDTVCMNDQFTQHALSFGTAGARWLKAIPGIIAEYEKKWSLKVSPPFMLSYNYVAPGKLLDGTQVVLKIGFPKDREFQTEINALSVFNGIGITKLIEADRKNCAILIERVTPGNPLSTIENDEDATRKIAVVMKKLRIPLPSKNNFITIAELSKEIPLLRKRYNGNTGPLPSYLVDKAERLFEELITTSSYPILVHGDLHQDNVLSSDRDGWIAIDPKGIAAEPAYETAAMIRNPYEKLKDISNLNLERLLFRRIMILSKELNIDPVRIHKWGLFQTVLSAVWNVEGVKGWQHAIRIAYILDKIRI